MTLPATPEKADNIITFGGNATSKAAVINYDVSLPGSDRPLRVTVSMGGQVRMCDPARTQSATQPDGCPAA